MSHNSGIKWFILDRRENCCKKDNQRFLKSLANRAWIGVFSFFYYSIYLSINPVKLLKSAQFLLWHAYIWTTTVCFPNYFTTYWTKSIFFHSKFPTVFPKSGKKLGCFCITCENLLGPSILVAHEGQYFHLSSPLHSFTHNMNNSNEEGITLDSL